MRKLLDNLERRHVLLRCERGGKDKKIQIDLQPSLTIRQGNLIVLRLQPVSKEERLETKGEMLH